MWGRRRELDKSFCLLLLWINTVNAQESFALSEATFDELTKGKNVFVKFYAPWCDHCKALAPAWEQLGREFRSDETLIAEVDCMQNEKFCGKLGIQGFPTILYGDPSHGGAFLQEYTSIEKTFEDLIQFAKENLSEPICSPGNLKACDEATQSKLETIWKMSSQDLASSIASQEEDIQTAKNVFSNTTQALQLIYDKATHEHQMNKARTRRKIRFLEALVQQRETRTSASKS